MEKVDIFVEICRKDAVLPKYARPGDAGMDVCAAEEVYLRPGETKLIPTGLKFAIPVGYELQVRPRSGISLKTPLRLSNSPGTIDSGYRGELCVIMTNTSPPGSGIDEESATLDNPREKGTYKIRKGDRIAQIVLQKLPAMNLNIVDSVDKIGVDRGGGFGSTGIR